MVKILMDNRCEEFSNSLHSDQHSVRHVSLYLRVQVFAIFVYMGASRRCSFQSLMHHGRHDI